MHQQSQVEEGGRRYSTVEGVFVPTLLTILGVILFLRTGWMVGNAGVLGGVGLIVLTFTIVGATALSLSSISTNVRPPPGGAYAIIARSFGVEAGGAVGLPLYLSQTLAIVLYTFGFREGWLLIFPGHHVLAVDLGMCAILVGVTLISTRAAFRVQYLILAVVVAALVSFGWAVVTNPSPGPVTLFGEFPGTPDDGFLGTDVWAVFAVFFPAATGIMAGLNMSGELRDPRRSIMRGTLAAVACTFVIYVLVAIGLALLVPPDELVGNYQALIDNSAIPPLALAGLLAATFSSALASLVGAPRILQAIAGHGLLPGSVWLERRDARGEPRNALLITIAIIVAAVLLVRELNAIAPLITLVFLMTYAAINLAVLVESTVGLASYRPTFRVPAVVPLTGAVGCLAAMAIIDPAITVGALVLAGVVLVWLGTRRPASPYSDIRSGALLALARWCTRRAAQISGSVEREWTPRVLVASADPAELAKSTAWIERLISDDGSIRFAVTRRGAATDGDDQHVREAVERLRVAGMGVSMVAVQERDDELGVLAALRWETNGDKDWAPNMVVTRFPDDPSDDDMTRDLLREAHERQVAVVLLPPGIPPGWLGRGNAPEVALWIRAQDPRWEIGDSLRHSDLALLMAYELTRDSRFNLSLVTAVRSPEDADRARTYLREVADLARLPDTATMRVSLAPFPSALQDVVDPDLNVLSIPPHVDFSRLRQLRQLSQAPCLFIQDSGVENAFE